MPPRTASDAPLGTRTAPKNHPPADPAALVYAAHEFAELGYRVFPVHRPRAGAQGGNEGKRPCVTKWPAAATKDLDRINKWWTKWEDANVGVVLPAGVVVLDLDSRDAVDLANSMGLPSTPTVITGRGEHRYFVDPSGTITSYVAALAALPKAQLIAGTGRFVVAPPSLHRSGTEYRWKPGHRLGVMPLAELPADLREPAAPVKPERPTLLHAVPAAPDLAPGDQLAGLVVGEGERNPWLFKRAGHHVRNGAQNRHLLELLHADNRAVCRPWLPAEEVDGIAARATWAPPPWGVHDRLAFVRRDSRLSPLARAVLGELVDRAKADGTIEVGPSLDTLREGVGCGKKKVSPAIKELVDAGRLEYTPGGHRRPSTYVLLPWSPPALAAKAGSGAAKLAA